MKRKKLAIILSTLIFILVITIFFLTLKYFSQLQSNIFSIIADYGFIGLFFIVLLLEMLFQPIAADIPLVALILAKANIYVVLATVLIASTSATIINYGLGRVYGRIGLKQLIKGKDYEKAYSVFRKYRRVGLLLASLTPVPYAPMCWIAGMFKMDKVEFFTYGMLPRTIRYFIDAYIALLILGL